MDFDEDDLEISSRPLMIADFVYLDRAIAQAYRYLETCPPEVKTFLEPVVCAACDHACMIADELGIDPNEVDTDKYVRLVWKPERRKE